jgi:2,4-dienoyl-CoA reductase-like NADH-dependent reductase (Old Yellow Enzyme family)/thioredoxin reductase
MSQITASDPRVSAMFQPLRLGTTELRNRFVFTAHGTRLPRNHVPSDELVAYHEARARGGAALIILEYTSMHHTDSRMDFVLHGYDEKIVPGYQRLAAMAHGYGTKLFVQTLHRGPGRTTGVPRPENVSASGVPFGHYYSESRPLRSAEIDEILAGYARCAELAQDGGLDGVEISAAHMILAAQFASPIFNQRADDWPAGPKFVLAAIAAVREAGPGLTVGVRLSADAPESAAIARQIAERVDYISLATGDIASDYGVARAVPHPPLPENLIESYLGPFADLGVPLIATGRVRDPLAAAAIVSAGKADAIGMVRAMITDPELPRKAAEGRFDEIMLCTGCGVCSATIDDATPIRCAVNPRAARELSFPAPDQLRGSTRRIAVVGAGPAGLAAAIEAGRFGCAVTVLEAGDRIGGQMALASAAFTQRDMATTLVANYERQLDQFGVELRLRSHASADMVKALEPDAVIVATGAVPYVPPQLRDSVVLGAWDVLTGEMPSAERIVTLDWGGDPTALACADVLATAGKQVILASAAATIGLSLGSFISSLYLERLYGIGVEILHHVELEEAAGGTIRLRNMYAHHVKHEIADAELVTAQGRVPAAGDLAQALVAAGLEVAEAGDCRTPRTLQEAVLEGTASAQEILRRLELLARAV